MDLFRNSSLEWIQSILSRSQQFSSHKSAAVARSTHKHHSRISNGSLIQKKPWGSANWPDEISKKLMEQNQKFFGAFLSMKSWKTVVSKEWQGKPIPHSVLHCLLGYIYALFKHHMFSQVSAVAKHHMPPFQVASRKTPCLCSQPNILPCVRFSRNIR